MHGYTYAWASKYASSRPLNTVLSSTANTHPFTAATCPRVSIYEYWCLLTQYAESRVFTSPAYTIAITDYAASVFQSQGPTVPHVSRPGTSSLLSLFLRPVTLLLRNEKVFSIFATDRIVQSNGCSLVDRSSFRGCFVGFVASLSLSLSLAELKGCFAGCEMVGVTAL